MLVLVLVPVVVVVVVRLPVTVPCPAGRSVVGTRLRLERAARCRDVEAHAGEHLGQHVVGLEHEAIGANLERNVAVAEVIRGAQRGRAALPCVAAPA